MLQAKGLQRRNGSRPFGNNKKRNELRMTIAVYASACPNEASVRGAGSDPGAASKA